jgi:hypothetical protein
MSSFSPSTSYLNITKQDQVTHGHDDTNVAHLFTQIEIKVGFAFVTLFIQIVFISNQLTQITSSVGSQSQVNA